ncbi:HAUS augmin-like complex subunit 6 [Physella acuta]|uniref:HAUS augmin-like complex subunit 6 n=1 Tax=Physella acuta TaxID=109671 RepID=UPI0027DB0C72|nr:HAUS augmin-like complex subunit 6 [Physella acuta]
MDEEMNTILFTNLQLLGMDIVDMEAKYKIPFNKNMFNLPNKAGSEAVFYFLFNRLNPSLCREQFRDCWPVTDKKTELQFRKVCNAWLTHVQKEEPDAHLPRMNASLLLSPGGRKFIHLLYSFSTFVLLQVMKMEHGWKSQDALVYPTMTPNLSAVGNVMVSSIQDSCCRERWQFSNSLQLILATNDQWKEYCGELVKEYRSLSKSLRDSENEKRQQVNITADSAIKHACPLPAKRTLTMFDAGTDAYTVKRAQRMEKVRSMWKFLSKFNESLAEKREIIQSILNKTASKYTIDGTEMGVRVPGLLLREHNKEIHNREIDNVYTGGCLNLVSIVLLWNICLKLYKEQLEKEKLPDVSQELPHISAQAHKHHSLLRVTQEIREELSKKTMPELKQDIELAQKKLNKLSLPRSLNSDNSDKFRFELTDPAYIKPAPVKSSKTGGTPKGPLAASISTKSTPDVIVSVSNKIESGISKHVSKPKPAQALQVMPGHFMKILRTNGTNENKSSNNNTEPSKPSKKAKRPPTAHLSTALQKPLRPSVKEKSHTKEDSKIKLKGKISSASTKVSSVASTPRTSKQKAVDELVDSVVESVLSNERRDLIGENLLELPGQLDNSAFLTKNLVGRSPIEVKTYGTEEDGISPIEEYSGEPSMPQLGTFDGRKDYSGYLDFLNASARKSASNNSMFDHYLSDDAEPTAGAGHSERPPADGQASLLQQRTFPHLFRNPRQQEQYQTPVKQTPVNQAQIKQTPVKQTPVNQTQIKQTPVSQYALLNEVYHSPRNSAQDLYQSPRNSAQDLYQSPRNSAQDLYQSPRNSAQDLYQSPWKQHSAAVDSGVTSSTYLQCVNHSVLSTPSERHPRTQDKMSFVLSTPSDRSPGITETAADHLVSPGPLSFYSDSEDSCDNGLDRSYAPVKQGILLTSSQVKTIANVSVSSQTPSDRTVEKLAQTPSDRTVEKLAQTPSDRTVEKLAQTPSDRTVEKLAQTPSDRTVEKLAQTPSDRTVEKLAQTTPDRTVEKLAQTPSDRTVEKLAQTPSDRTVEKLAQTPSDRTVEKLAQTPSDRTVEKLAQTPSDRTVEKLAQTPSDSIVEKLAMLQQKVSHILNSSSEGSVHGEGAANSSFSAWSNDVQSLLQNLDDSEGLLSTDLINTDLLDGLDDLIQFNPNDSK